MRPALLASAALIAMLAFAPSASAQTDALITGQWRYAGDQAESTQRARSITRAISNISTFFQDRARSMLTERTNPPSRIKVRQRGQQLRLEGRGHNVTVRIGGASTQVERDGDTATVQARVVEGVLTVTSTTDRGTRIAKYYPAADGQTLVIDIEVRSNMLAAPVRYRMTYRRVRAAAPAASSSSMMN